MSEVRRLIDEGGEEQYERDWFDHEIEIEEELARKYPNVGSDDPSAAPAVPANGAIHTDKPAAPLLGFAAAVEDWAQPLPPPMPTGFPELDRMIGGFRAESVYVLNAPTGRGKTGLAIQMASFTAKTRPVLYLSSELSRRQILARFAAQLMGCSWLDVYNFEPAQMQKVAEVLCKVPKMRAHELRRKDSVADLCKRVADIEGVAPLLVLDYLQHAARRLNPEDMKRAVSSLSDEIATYARETRGAVLMVSAVARGFYHENQDKTATDFVGASKESGDVDYDAAGVFFLDCEIPGLDGTSPARLHIAKSRFSHGGTIGLEFNGRIGKFKADPAGGLTEEQRDVFNAVRDGVESLEELTKNVKMRKADVMKLVKLLASRHLITRNPLAVVPTK